MSGYQHPDLVALDEIEDLLEAYAEVRLAPTSPVLARMRRAVLAEAASTEAAKAALLRAATDAAPRARLFALPRLWALQRLRAPAAAWTLGFAIVLGAGTSAAVLAAPPGSPFFNARVALEQVFLPVEVGARLAAHEEHLAARLAEAEAAAARGDSVALAAALAAFDAEVALAVAEIGNDADRLARLEAMLAKHVAILAVLEATAPEQASVDKAIENSQKAIVKIKAKGQPPARPSHAPGGQSAPGPEGERDRGR